ncbi:MAG: MFS transporter [Gammaproteobacteria bacterium]|nr:MFS transporter [Gammaproteobacteria bacterium]
MRNLPLSSKLGFGVGQMAEGVKTTVFNTFVLFYYNQIVGVSATLTALALGLAVFFDAVSDPVAGYLSDRTRTRWGRRHPWILAAALPFGLSLAFLFNPPAGMGDYFYFAWLLAASVAVRLFLTLYHVPHLALGAEMAHDYVDRTRVFGYSTVFGVIGGYGFWFFAMTVFFATPEDGSHGMYQAEQYLPFSLAAGAVVVSTILLCAGFTWKEIPHLHEPQGQAAGSISNFSKQMMSVFRNASYVRIIIGLILLTTVVAIEAVFNAFMGVHFWELPTEDLRWLAIAVFLGLPFAFVLAPVLTRAIDKRMTLISCAAVLIINGNFFVCLRLFTDVLPANGDPLIFWCVMSIGFVGGVTGPIVLIMINSMFADIADEQELITGERQEGIIYSARSFALKATAAIGGIFGGMALDLIAFPRQAPPGTVEPDVIFNLGLVAGPLTSVFTFFGLLLFLGYRLDQRRVSQIKVELEERRAAAPGA